MFISLSGTEKGRNLNPQVNTCLQSLQLLPLGFRCPNWMWPSTCCFLPQSRSTGQLGGRWRGGEGGGEVTWRVSDWSTSVGCWHCLHVLHPGRLSAARWVAALFVCSLCVALAVFVSCGSIIMCICAKVVVVALGSSSQISVYFCGRKATLNRTSQPKLLVYLEQVRRTRFRILIN